MPDSQQPAATANSSWEQQRHTQQGFLFVLILKSCYVPVVVLMQAALQMRVAGGMALPP
jgi:hypothetical protein